MKITGVNPYIHVSAARATALKPGWKKPMPVLVRINGEPKEAWHINMMPMGNGSFYLYLHGDVRKASATKVGDRAKVELRFDETYQNGPRHQMPEWFSIPLSKNPKATRTWNALPPSRQKEILRYFAGLKSETARTRNLEKALRVLRGERARFMARDWQDGK
ncbi:MAG: hypothetical protein JWM56_303 [Candidatus Peribacteria bacterium]|nr:hypothetical protein [Candidatus Peribacteria bacterium]